jgi:hypothetical protein
MKKGVKASLIIIGILIGVFLIIQLVPFGRQHTNPAIVSKPNWDSTQTETLAKRVCYDCHSNETVWPWYSNIAPISWLVQKDVNKGRMIVNFSDWNTFIGMTKDMVVQINQDKMPPFYYVWLHPTAKLSAAENQQLIQGLYATAQK